ncbi:hypothetical protein GQ457_06G012970 [Hibiscus cannabinus]
MVNGFGTIFVQTENDHQEKQIQSEAQIDGLTTIEKILEVCNHQQLHLWLPLHISKLGETHNPPTSRHISMEPTMPIGRTE